MLKHFTAFLIIICFIGSSDLLAQSAQIPMHNESYHLLERLEVKSGRLSNTFHTNIKPFQRREVIDFLSSIDTVSYLKLSPVDRWNVDYLSIDSWEFLDSLNQKVADSKKPIFGKIYEKKNDLYQFKNEDFDIHASPIFYFGGGRSTTLTEKRPQFINTRGVELRGRVGKKLGFYTYLTENQRSSTAYFRDYSYDAKSFPYYGLTKVTNEDTLKYQHDYFGAEGYLVFQPSKHFAFRFGHAKNFVGSGVRSMILSDFTAPYLQFNAEVKLGRLQYYNIFASLTDTQIFRPADNTITFPSKYMAFHHLNINVAKNVNVGIFEKVMFGRDNGFFDLNYLNPIIFYRFVEGYLGSSDNALVGIDFKANFLKSFSLYGQYVLDEWNNREFKKDGWWAKKNAGQIGLKYIDVFGIDQLDVQGEFNYARPYTFSHYSTESNGVHYGMPMAHPLGANFQEGLVRLTYQPIPQLSIQSTFLTYFKGYDTDTLNYGGDILLNNRVNRPNDYGNFIGQGSKRTTQMADLRASYMLKHNLWLELGYIYRKSTGTDLPDQRENVFNFALRLNFGREAHLF